MEGGGKPLYQEEQQRGTLERQQLVGVGVDSVDLVDLVDVVLETREEQGKNKGLDRHQLARRCT